MKPIRMLVPLMAAILYSCGDSASTQESVNYSVMTVRPDTVTLNELYSASIKGRHDIDIYPQVSGTITKVCQGRAAGEKRASSFHNRPSAIQGRNADCRG